MKQGRMPWLLTVVAVLLLLRWFAPLQPASKSVETVLPNTEVGATNMNVNTATSAQVTQATLANVTQTQASDPQSRVGGDQQVNAVDGSIGNAFAVRSPPAPDTPTAPAPSVALVQATAPPPVMVESVAPPPPPPPPLQVIGTWDDGVSPGVFISTPQATVLARQDTVLMSDYRVVSISAGTVSLLQLSSQSAWNLVIPQNAPPARSATGGGVPKRPSGASP